MLKKKNKIRSGFVPSARSGFTLIEIILVVALTLFLLVVTVQGFVNSASQFSFGNTDEKIQSMIRDARSLAINGKAQIDYTDYNKDGCKDKATTPSCPADDYVTPAHYGVNFSNSSGKYTVTLFADNHSASTLTGKEGVYDLGNDLTDYHNGKDIMLDQITLPPGMQLIIPRATDGTTNPGDGTSATIFFSPIFADVSSDITIPDTSPFFRFGISQTAGSIIRKRCSQIHLLAGIAEPMPGILSPTTTKCL